MPKRHSVYIAGEALLIREYGALCLDRKLTVAVRANPGEPGKLPRGAKKNALPPRSTSLALELTNIAIDAKKKNLILLDRLLSPSVPILTSSVTVTVAEQSSWIRNPSRLVGIGALPSLLEGSLIELAPSRATSNETVKGARDFITMLGKEAALVQDSIGLIMPRILCMITNEAYFAIREGVAESRDIDTAMKLGTNYPSGPVERGEKIGITNVYAVLNALQRHFGEDRYRPAPLLQQAAFLRV